MGRVIYNGLHWNVGSDNTTTRPQFNAGQGFSAAHVLAIGNITYTASSGRSYSTSYNGWKEVCDWIRNNQKRSGEIVLRLFWPRASSSSFNLLEGDPGATLGQGFYNQIIQPAIDLFGIRNFQILNELNIEYEQYKTRSTLSGDMYNIAWWIKRLAVQNNRGVVYLGFPGPGGITAQDPAGTAWAAYWDGYKANITKSTDQGSAYNWLGVHTYEYSADALVGRMQAQYDSLQNRIPNYPHRYTEYGISLDGAGWCPTLPCTNASAFQSRADALKSAIQRFKSYVDARTGPDVWSVHNYIAYDTGSGQQDGADTRFELVLNNNNLGPAQTLASAF